MKKQLLGILTVVFLFTISAFAQSTDADNPTTITSAVLEGSLRGENTYVYSLKSKRGTTVTVKTELMFSGDSGPGFSLDFRGKGGVTGGQTNCCEGETYMPFSADKTMEISFRVITDESFLMFLSFNTGDTPMRYRINFDGLNFDAEPTNDENTIIVPGNSGSRWVDTGIDLERGDRVILSATGTVSIGGSWGTHDALGTTRFARVGGYPLNSPRRYGLIAKIGSQKWAYTDDGVSITATRRGRFYLTCNDDSPNDNDGKFIVNVQVIRRR